MTLAGVEPLKASINRLEEGTNVRILLCFIVLFFSLSLLLLKYSLFNYLLFFSSLFSGLLTSLYETFLLTLKSRGEFYSESKIVLFSSLAIIIISLLSFLNAVFIPSILILSRIFLFFYCTNKIYKISINLSRMNISSVKKFFSRMKYFSVDSIVSSLSIQLDGILISALLGNISYGLYQPFSRLYNACLTSIGSLGAFAIPYASRMSNKAQQWISLNIFFILFGCVVSFLFLDFTEKLIIILFGYGFLEYSEMIPYLSILIFIRFGASAVGSFLSISGKQKKRALINLFITFNTVVSVFLFYSDAKSIIKIIMLNQCLLYFIYFLFSISVLLNYKGVTRG